MILIKCEGGNLGHSSCIPPSGWGKRRCKEYGWTGHGCGSINRLEHHGVHLVESDDRERERHALVRKKYQGTTRPVNTMVFGTTVLASRLETPLAN